MKLKNRKIRQLLKTLVLLDPPHEQGKPKPVSHFTFSGNTRFLLSMNLLRLREVDNTVSEVQVRLLNESGLKFKSLPDGNAQLPSDQPEELARFNQQVTDLLETEVEIALQPISVKDLDLDKNQINTDLLSQLIGTIVVPNTDSKT